MAAIARVAATFGHELNNPLAAIVASAWFSAEVVEELDATLRAAEDRGPAAALDAMAAVRRRIAELVEGLSDVRKGAERASDVVQQMRRLGFARPLALRSVDLIAALDDAMRLAGADEGRVAKQLSAVPLVVGHEGQVAQAIACVLENALEASAAAPTTVVGVATGTDDAGRAFVEVRDQGEGIPRERHERVFDAFFTTRGEGKRLGLGLTIARHVVTEAGGEVTLESAPGRGTTVRISLPPA